MYLILPRGLTVKSQMQDVSNQTDWRLQGFSSPFIQSAVKSLNSANVMPNILDFGGGLGITYLHLVNQPLSKISKYTIAENFAIYEESQLL